MRSCVKKSFYFYLLKTRRNPLLMENKDKIQQYLHSKTILKEIPTSGEMSYPLKVDFRNVC